MSGGHADCSLRCTSLISQSQAHTSLISRGGGKPGSELQVVRVLGSGLGTGLGLGTSMRRVRVAHQHEDLNNHKQHQHCGVITYTPVT